MIGGGSVGFKFIHCGMVSGIGAKPSIAAKGFGKTAGVEVNGVLHWIQREVVVICLY